MLKLKDREDKNEILLLILMIIVSVFSALLFVISTLKKSFSNVDLGIYWRAFSEGIHGELSNTLVMPYGRIIGNLVIPGYLPYSVARIYYFTLMLLVVLLISREIFTYLQERKVFENDRRRIVATICVISIPWYWSDALITGNIGGILALFCVLSAFYIKRHENVAALLLALAMIKPQIGLIFLFALFLKKEFRLFIKVVLIDVGSWIAYSGYSFVVMKVNARRNQIPIESVNFANLSDITNTVSGYSASSVNQGTQEGAWYFYYGLFNPLISKGVPVYIVLILSALAGAAFIIAMLFLIRKDRELANDYVLLFSITALASLFWCYKSQSDAIVLILCNLIVLYLIKQKDFETAYTLLGFIIIILMNCILCKYGFRLIIPIFDYVEAILGDMLLQIGAFSVVVVTLVKIRKGREE